MTDDSGHEELEALRKRIGAAERQARPSPKEKVIGGLVNAKSNVARAMRVGSDVIALIVGCGIFGWVADQYLDTTPWFLISLVVIGFVAGFVVVVKFFLRESRCRRQGPNPEYGSACDVSETADKDEQR
ncbi:MAG: AtpZ/AtpI family protein [Alphaproteobacteria bacterium]|nr:AtpZ/AtpI family protein [Alphaproteobacteria bacterium]